MRTSLLKLFFFVVVRGAFIKVGGGGRCRCMPDARRLRRAIVYSMYQLTLISPALMSPRAWKAPFDKSMWLEPQDSCVHTTESGRVTRVYRRKRGGGGKAAYTGVGHGGGDGAAVRSDLDALAAVGAGVVGRAEGDDVVRVRVGAAARAGVAVLRVVGCERFGFLVSFPVPFHETKKSREDTYWRCRSRDAALAAAGPQEQQGRRKRPGRGWKEA